jgi:hypothetical protein
VVYVALPKSDNDDWRQWGFAGQWEATPFFVVDADGARHASALDGQLTEPVESPVLFIYNSGALGTEEAEWTQHLKSALPSTEPLRFWIHFGGRDSDATWWTPGSIKREAHALLTQLGWDTATLLEAQPFSMSSESPWDECLKAVAQKVATGVNDATLLVHLDEAWVKAKSYYQTRRFDAPLASCWGVFLASPIGSATPPASLSDEILDFDSVVTTFPEISTVGTDMAALRSAFAATPAEAWDPTPALLALDRLRRAIATRR